MNRKEFGALIAALRKDHRDLDDSLFTQARLAQLAGLSEMTIGNIERGTKEKFEADIIIKLANALKLTSGERIQFLLAASGVKTEDLLGAPDLAQKALHVLVPILEQLHTPAFISDSFGDLIYVNPVVLSVYNFDLQLFSSPEEPPATRFNVMRVLFAPEFESQRKMMGNTWPPFALQTILLFRVTSFRYKGHPYFRQNLLPELNKYPLFRRYWQTPRTDEELLTNLNFITLNHPAWGLLKFVSDPMQTITSFGDLNLYSFQPLGLETAKTCIKIAEQAGLGARSLAPWPKIL